MFDFIQTGLLSRSQLQPPQTRCYFGQMAGLVAPVYSACSVRMGHFGLWPTVL
jgi:hypothetical protein